MDPAELSVCEVRGMLFHGKIVEFPNEEVSLERSWHTAFPQISEFFNLHRDGWVKFIYRCESPFATSDQLSESGGFEYEFLVRQTPNNYRAIFLGQKIYYVEELFRRLGWSRFCSCPAVLVPEIVELLSTSREIYKIGGITANISGYGKSLRTISLWGTDLASADLYHLILPSASVYKFKLLESKGRQDILEISSNGHISISGMHSDQLQLVDQSIAFFQNQGYIDWRGDAF